MRSSFGFWSGMLLLAALTVVTVHSVYVSQETGRLVEELSDHRVGHVSEDTLVCQGIRNTFPQTAEAVSEKYDVPVERVQLVPFFQCDKPGRYAIWGFLVTEGDPIEVVVPVGGRIVVYDTAKPEVVGSGTAIGGYMSVQGPYPDIH